MRPVFDRLAELAIPPAVDVDIQAAQGQDMTLIHALDALIENGLQGDETPVDTPLGLVEILLRERRGTAALESFLHDLAIAKGSQRLGRKMRAGLEADLGMLVQQGKVAIGGGEIRLL